MATYYVDASNPANGVGSAGNPWKRISLATAAAMNPGDIVRVKAGTYQEEVRIPAGHAGVTWIADDPNNRPVIDGRYHVGLMSSEPSGSARMPDPKVGNYFPAGGKGALVTIVGDNITLDGFIIQNSADTGLLPAGDNILIQNCVVFFCWGTCLLINPGAGRQENATIRNNRFLYSSIMIFDPTRFVYNPKCAAQCVAGCVKVGNTTGQIIIEGNEVAYGFGEGINLGRGSSANLATAPIICQDNFVHDCNHVHIYANGIRGVIIRRNAIFSSTGAELNAWTDGEYPAAIRIMDENKDSQRLRDIHIYDNIIVNAGKLLQWGSRGTVSQNLYFGFNTWVPGPVTVAGIDISLATYEPYTGTPQKGIFENNIIGDMPAGVAISKGNNPKGDDGVTFRANNWAVLPQERFRGAGDVTGTPRLKDPTAQIRTTNYLRRAHTSFAASGVSHNFNANNYRVTSSSPGKDKASARAAASTTTPPVEPFNKDYFQANRANPDIGAVEYDGVVPDDVVAAFSGTPRSGNAPLSVTFTDLSTTTGNAAINSWAWTFGDGGTSTSQNPTRNYAAPGTYNVTLTVQDTVRGLSDAITQTGYITVGSPPLNALTAAFNGSPRTGAAALQVTFTDQSTTSGSASINRRAWTFGDGGTSTERNPVHSYAAAGTYSVTLTVYDDSLGLSDGETKNNYITVTASNGVDAAFSADVTSGAAPLEVTFTDASTDTGTAAIDSWSWDFGDGGTSTEQNPVYTYGTPGSYTVTLTVGDTALGLNDAATATILVTNTPPVSGGDVVIRQTRAAAPTAGTTWDITAAGLGGITPKMVRLEITKATADGTAADGAMLGVGMATGATAQWAWCIAADHGAADTNAARRERHNDTCLLAIDGSGTVLGRLSFNAWIADGVVLNVDDPFPAGYLITARFFAGTDMQVWAGVLYANTSGSVQTVTEPGFMPDAVEAHAVWAGHDTAANGASVAVGLSHRLSGATQYMVDRTYPDGTATADDTMRLYQDQVVHYRAADGSRAKVVIENYGGEGFNARTATGDIQKSYMAAAFKFGSAASGLALIDTPLNTTPLDYATDADPQFVYHIVSAVPALGGTNSNQDAGVLGFHAATADGEYTNTIASEHGATTTNEQSLSDNRVNVPTHSGATLMAGSTTLGTAEYTLTMTTANGTARKWPRLWVGVGQATGGDPVVADFTTNSLREGFTPLRVDFIDLSGGAVTEWAWDFGDGGTSTEQNPSYTYRIGGVYTVELTVSDGTDTNTVTRTGYVTAREAARARLVVGPIRLRDRDDLDVSETHLDPDSAERGYADIAWGRSHPVLWLAEGQAEPDAREGALALYWAADGTLKAKLPDGTVKTVNWT